MKFELNSILEDIVAVLLRQDQEAFDSLMLRLHESSPEESATAMESAFAHVKASAPETYNWWMEALLKQKFIHYLEPLFVASLFKDQEKFELVVREIERESETFRVKVLMKLLINLSHRDPALPIWVRDVISAYIDPFSLRKLEQTVCELIAETFKEPVKNTQQLVQDLEVFYDGSVQAMRSRLTVDPKKVDLQTLLKDVAAQGFQQATLEYHEFREGIHDYQLEHYVSGLIWHELSEDDRTLRYPELHPRLEEVPGDREVVIQHSAAVIAFWKQWAAGKDLYSVGLMGPKSVNPIQPDWINREFPSFEWATIVKSEFSDLVLYLGWGHFNDSRMPGRPLPAGRIAVHAVPTGTAFPKA